MIGDIISSDLDEHLDEVPYVISREYVVFRTKE